MKRRKVPKKTKKTKRCAPDNRWQWVVKMLKSRFCMGMFFLSMLISAAQRKSSTKPESNRNVKISCKGERATKHLWWFGSVTNFYRQHDDPNSLQRWCLFVSNPLTLKWTEIKCKRNKAKNNVHVCVFLRQPIPVFNILCHHLVTGVSPASSLT